jgi:sorbitol/mannitol transport system permease protein
VKIADRSILPSVAGRGGVRVKTAASVTRRAAWARRLPFLPAFIYVFLVTQIPFALTIYYSFFSWNLLKPGSFQFAGLENYAALLTDESIRIAVWNTVLLTVSVIVLSVVIGMGVAMLLNSEVFGKGLMRTLMIAPFLIMPTAAALIWKDTLLNPLFGLIPYLLTPLGLGRVDWVAQFPMVSVVAVEVWRWTPFMMLIILAGLQSQNPEILEAARVDGANALQTFRRITLPLVRPFVELGALLGSLFVVQTFDSIYMLTYGGPGEDTTNVPFKLYLVAFQGYNIGQASAIGVVAVIITIIVATFALRTLFSIFQVEARR